MTTKAIKNISDEVWRDFKVLASLKNMKLAELFEEIVDNAKKDTINGIKSWDNLFKARLIKNPSKTKKKAYEIRNKFTMR